MSYNNPLSFKPPTSKLELAELILYASIGISESWYFSPRQSFYWNGSEWDSLNNGWKRLP